MFSKKFYVLLLITLASCVQNEADIIYKEGSDYVNVGGKKNNFQPSYMKGTYVKTADNTKVRDLRKNNNKDDIKEEENIVEQDIEEKEEETKLVEDNNKQIITIKVKRGDNLTELAKEYNMMLSSIIKLNNLKKPYNIYIGQNIKVYSTDKKEQNISYKTIKVESGDSLLRIALKHDLTLREIASINNIKPPYNVYIGQNIKIPLKNNNSNNRTKNVAKNKDYYIVKRGDNLYNIAKYNNISVNELIKNNNLKKPYNIYAGQKLFFNKQQVQQVKKEQKTEIKQEVKQEEKKQELVVKTEKKSNAMFMWPVKGEVIKTFGKQKSGETSDAIHIKADKGTPILAANKGEVAYAGNELKGYGNIIIIKHDNGWLSIYGYCDTINVKLKDKISKGQQIATVGQTGNINEPQLYFTVRKGRVAMDPIQYLDK